MLELEQTDLQNHINCAATYQAGAELFAYIGKASVRNSPVIMVNTAYGEDFLKALQSVRFSNVRRKQIKKADHLYPKYYIAALKEQEKADE